LAVRVIAAGRASEIVDLADGRVLRRFKGGGNPAREAAISLADPNVTDAERERVSRLLR
jgi:hypothetical protein